MKVYICSDLEGAACVFSRREGYVNAAEYGAMELIAICEALLANGVDDILINCFHILPYAHSGDKRDGARSGGDPCCDKDRQRTAVYSEQPLACGCQLEGRLEK